MLVAYYKGQDRLFNRFVSWKDEGPYSHVEAVFYRAAVYLDKPFNRYMCASASFQDGGVRFKEIDLTPDHWDIINVPAFDRAYSYRWFSDNEFYIDEAGVKRRTPYDVRGLVSYVVPVGHNPNGYFCSEAVLASNGMDEPRRFSPNAAARICERLPGSVWIQGGPSLPAIALSIALT